MSDAYGIQTGDYVRFVVDPPEQGISTGSGGLAGRGYVVKELMSLAEIQVVAGEVEINYLPKQVFLALEAGQSLVIDKAWLTPLQGTEYEETRDLHNAQLMMGSVRIAVEDDD